MPIRRPRVSRDRGATALEYAGMISLAGILLVAIVGVLVSPPTVRDAVRVGVCKILSAGQGDCGSFTVTNPHLPTEPCVTSSRNVSQGLEATVAVVHLGGGQDYEYAKLSDGRVRITRLDSSSLGGQLGVGEGVSVTGFGHTVGQGATAEATADLNVQGGQTWYTDQAGAQQFFDTVKSDGTKDAVLGAASPQRGIWEAGEFLVDRVTGHRDPKIPPADETFVEGGVTLNAAAEARDGIGASAEIGGSEALGYRTHQNGDRTIYIRTKADADVGADLLAAAPGAAVDGDLITAVTMDKTGAMTQVSTTLTAAGPGMDKLAPLAEKTQGLGGGSAPIGDTVVYQATLPVRSDRDRAVALDYLAATGVTHLSMLTVQPGFLAARAGAVHQGLTGFRDAVADHGQLTRLGISDGDKGVHFGGKADVEAGPGLGGGFDYETSQARTTSADYWDGATWQAWKGCTG